MRDAAGWACSYHHDHHDDDNHNHHHDYDGCANDHNRRNT
jgi:hypothetical protein